MNGDDVAAWQTFLNGQGDDTGGVDGDFGPMTDAATKAFQDSQGLDADGEVGPHTLAAAEALGFTEPAPADPDFPPKPADMTPLVTFDDRAAVFGAFTFRAAPTHDDPENVEILGGWEQANIIVVPIPQLDGIMNGRGRMQFHRLAAAQLQKMWSDWEAAGLLDRVLAFDGSFVPRFVRGSTTSLSNHAFGSAFDINATFNPFHKQPALLGERGCVRELVQIANKNGFWWGGHFSQPDGMHFEVAKLQ